MSDAGPEGAEKEPLEAVVVVPGGFDAQTTMAGLTLLVRHVLSMQQAGARRVQLVGPGITAPDDPRIAIAVDVVDAPQPVDTRALVVRADVTMHRQLPARLTFSTVPACGLLRVGSAAHVWLSAAERVEGLCRALLAGEQPEDFEQEPLLDNEFALPVATDKERRRAFQAHLDSLIKPEGGYFEKRYMRPLSKQMTRLLTPTPITPNQMSIITLGIAFWAAYLVSLPDRTSVIVGGLMHIFMRVVDCVDGELARLRYQSSRFGQWLDTVGDGIGMAAFVAGVTVHVSRIHPQWFVPGMYGVAAWCVVQGIQYYVAVLQGGGGYFLSIEWGHRAEHKTAIEALIARVELMFRIDAITVVYGLLAAFGMMRTLLVVHLLSATGAVFYFGGQLRKLRSSRP